MPDDWLDDHDEAAPAESRWGDPERDLPRVPEVSSPDPGDADTELLTLFWASVVAANVALLGLALGPMLIVFRGNWKLGGVSVAVGAFALYRTYVYYRRVQTRRADDNDADENADTSEVTAGDDTADRDGDDAGTDDDDTGTGDGDDPADA